VALIDGTYEVVGRRVLNVVVFSCFVLLLTIYLSPGAVLPTDELLADNQFFISRRLKKTIYCR